jgi:hypothetical protein
MAASYTLRDMPPELWRRIKAAAAYDGISIKVWLLKAAEEKLNNDKKKEDAMNYYAVIDNHSGYLWGIAKANSPQAACEQVDNDISPDLPREYLPISINKLAANDTAYHVFEIDLETYNSLQDEDGQDEAVLDAINKQGELVEVFKIHETD